jgi:serine/threonine-protein kinase
VRLYDFGEAAGGMRYYAMELLDGITLEDLVSQWGPQPEARVRALLIQACDSLAEAHEAGLIHRDIKPANIMLCQQGKQREIVKVLDFGLVLDRKQPVTPATFSGTSATIKTGDARLTQQGMMMGTPAFIAPEQAMGLGTVDGRADLYALGCVAYYLVTGRDVFEGTIDQILRGHVDHMPPPPSTRPGCAPLSASFEMLLMRCLAKRPEGRPASAWAMRDELLRQQEQEQAQRWGEQQQAAWYAQRGLGARAEDPDATQEHDVSGLGELPRLMKRRAGGR